MRKYFAVIMILVLSLALVSCGAGEEEKETGEMPVLTNMASEETLSEVTEALREAGVSGADTFSGLVEEFNTACKGKGLEGGWIDPAASEVDTFGLMDAWESGHDTMDANCRLTVFTILGDQIETGEPEEYKGDYLMFDIDTIDNSDAFSHIKDQKDKFETVYGEFDTSTYKGHEEMAFPEVMKERGVVFPEGKASILSLVTFDEMTGVAFVGHTGVLLDEGDHILYVEKVAFEQQYNAIKASSLEDIVDILKERPEYYGDGTEPGPFIYRNAELVCDLHGERPEM